ncbi:MAG TPA: GreA/GreB family elongation factor [Aldersonia sp.]
MTTSTERVWMTAQAHSRLRSELDQLLAERNLEVTDDLSGNTGALRSALQARIHQVHDLLGNAVVGQDPTDDGIAEPGMVLTVRYDETGETETFLLAVPDVDDGEIEVYSMKSPLGAAIAGSQPGERRTYRTPSGATVAVTLLQAVPYGLHRS